MKIQIFDNEGKTAKTLEASKSWEKIDLAPQAIKDAMVYYRAKMRRGTAKVKGRSEVNLTKKKPWRQKGTGRARVGTAANPIWRKGGVVFGPIPRDFSIGLPKKVRILALKSLISERLKNKNLIIIENLKMDKPKTKDAAELLNKLKSGKKPLIITSDLEKNKRLSFRNVSGAGLCSAQDLNAYILLKYRKIIVEKKAWEMIEYRLLHNNKKGK